MAQVQFTVPTPKNAIAELWFVLYRWCTTINNRDIDEYFGLEIKLIVRQPLKDLYFR